MGGGREGGERLACDVFYAASEPAPRDRRTSPFLSLSRSLPTHPRTTKRVGEVKFHPSVVEPSFGIGRILTGLWEHCFYVRPGADEQRAVLALSPSVAPLKCTVFPLDARIDRRVVKELSAALNAAGVSHIVSGVV